MRWVPAAYGAAGFGLTGLAAGNGASPPFCAALVLLTIAGAVAWCVSERRPEC
jgi:MYXO-CTERM domain-containing protein